VLLVSGSGPQDRNEEVFGHKPFLVIADHLSRKGIAVLRVDDRGIGGSTGDFGSATSDDFARDAQACVAWLRGQKGIDPKRVGLIGHSEGGLIAPIVAGRDPELAFVMLLAGPAMDGTSIIVDQTARIRRAAGVEPATIERLSAQQKRVFEIVGEVTDSSVASARVRALVRESLDMLPASDRAQVGDPDTYIDRMMQTVSSPWFRFFLSHDPRPGLAAMRCPSLALFGEKDLQVSPELNRAPMEQALRASGNTDATVRVLPGLNHLFQQAETGLPTEYMQIEQTFDPSALNLMSGWILERFGPAGRAAGR
jgi:pimeloyl-ACP methyl ester carboxylesterase